MEVYRALVGIREFGEREKFHACPLELESLTRCDFDMSVGRRCLLLCAFRSLHSTTAF